jgi:hypothetical protein
VFHVFLGSNLWFGLLLEVKLHCLYLLVSSPRFVGRVLQGANLGFGIPCQLHLLDLKEAAALFTGNVKLTFIVDYALKYL